MTIIAERIPGTWFDRLTPFGPSTVRPEPFDSPFVLRFSKDEWRLRTGFVEGCRNVCANNYVVMYRSQNLRQQG